MSGRSSELDYSTTSSWPVADVVESDSTFTSGAKVKVTKTLDTLKTAAFSRMKRVKNRQKRPQSTPRRKQLGEKTTSRAQNISSDSDRAYPRPRADPQDIEQEHDLEDELADAQQTDENDPSAINQQHLYTEEEDDLKHSESPNCHLPPHLRAQAHLQQEQQYVYPSATQTQPQIHYHGGQNGMNPPPPPPMPRAPARQQILDQTITVRSPSRSRSRQNNYDDALSPVAEQDEFQVSVRTVGTHQ